MRKPARILYCHCAYARVVPEKVKEEVLHGLCRSGVAFDAVADLCEMSARRDPALKRIAEAGAVKIAACYPRAVRWLFSAGQAPLPHEGVEILNMRVENADSVVNSLLGENSVEVLTQSDPAPGLPKDLSRLPPRPQRGEGESINQLSPLPVGRGTGDERSGKEGVKP